jgi:shikimate dehydrogenase
VLSGLTSVAGVVGGPRQVARSLSPAIHNAGYRALGLDWVYVGFPVAAEGADAVAVLRGLGGSGVAGFNVTMPHKLAAAEAVDRLAGQAAVVGAVNAVEVTGSELVGWNTDGEGLASFLVRETDTDLDGCALVVIGAGGSARSVVSGLVLAGAGSVTVLARDPDRAAALAPMAGEGPFRALPLEASGSASASAEAVGAADVIVNATPVGQEGEAPLIPVESIRPGTVVVDLVYHPLETPLVQAASRAGARAYGGLGMLVHQAALAFEIFTGRSAPLEAMWAGAREALARP